MCDPLSLQRPFSEQGTSCKGQDVSVGSLGRVTRAGVVGVGCAGVGAWVGQRLGGSAATVGLGAAVGAVSGAFAPSVAGAIVTRGKARDRVASSVVLARSSGQHQGL